MNTKFLSFVMGLAVLASIGTLYFSKTNVSEPDLSNSYISDPEFYSYLDPEELQYRISLFKDWINANEKQYSVSETAVRFHTWNKNYEFVQDHNSKNLSWTVEMNQFSDLSSEEFGSLYLGYNAQLQNNEEDEEHVEFLDENNLAASIDWRTKGAITTVKDQSSCGGCYAFSAGAGIEGILKIKKNVLKDLSPQQVIDCSSGYGNQGCNGGLMTNSFKYIIAARGIETEVDYPYRNAKRTCVHQTSKSFTTISGYKIVTRNNYKQLQAAVNQQPIPVAVMASGSAFQLYKSGVISNCGTRLDHAILAVGYEGTNYWIVKNQWGTRWGEKGYAKIAMGSQNSGLGVCGINMEASYPTM